MNNKIIDDHEGATTNPLHIDMDRLQRVDSHKRSGSFWSVSKGRNVHREGTVPASGAFDHEHFLEDVYLLYSAKNDPDKLISLLHELNNLYIWPALAISMITFPDPQDITRFVVHKSRSKRAVPAPLDNTDKVWDMTSEKSVPRWMLTLPNLSYLNFNQTHISYWKKDAWEQIFSKDLPWEEFIDRIAQEDLFHDEQDPKLDFSKIHRTEFCGNDPISSAIMAPIYSPDNVLRGIFYIAYERPNVMEGITSFDYTCVLDIQHMLEVLSLCLSG